MNTLKLNSVISIGQPCFQRISHGSIKPIRKQLQTQPTGLLQLPKTSITIRQPITITKASADAAVPQSPQKSNLGATLYLGMLFGLWYLFNIYFNIYNKQVLKVYPYPLTETVVQFGVGSCIAIFMWLFRIVKAPKLTWDVIKNQIMVVGSVHTLGNTFTNLSLGAVAVSFTHTIKAMEPFFSVVLSWIFLGEKSSLPVLLSLIPIVGGVVLASMTEVSFNWLGFGTAMASNLTFQSRNVLSKKLMNNVKGPKLDNVNIFSLVTITSFFFLLPFAIYFEGFHFYPAAMKEMGILNAEEVIKKAMFAGFFFHMYQQVSYMILSRVSPVTHSIGNCVKRVIIIVASVFVFQNPMTNQSIFGTTLALSGVFLYSQMKQRFGKGGKGD